MKNLVYLPLVQARLLGVKRYFNLIPCRQGHSAERFVNSQSCCECAALANKSEYRKKYLKRYKDENYLKLTGYLQKWTLDNIERKRKADKNYKQNNPEAVYASNRRRDESKRRRSVAWDIELTDFAFAECLKLAKARKKITGFSWHVDHIIPLCGKEVSGLHIWNNFQVLPSFVNAEKKDRLTYIEPFSWMKAYERYPAVIYMTEYNAATLQCTCASTDSGFATLEEVRAMMGEPVNSARHMLCYDGVCFSDFVLHIDIAVNSLVP